MIKKIIIGAMGFLVITGGIFYYLKKTNKQKIELTQQKTTASKKMQNEQVNDDSENLMAQQKTIQEEYDNSPKVSTNTFERNKLIIPLYIELTQTYRNCLTEAQQLSEAQLCTIKIDKERKAKNIEEDENYLDEIISWDKQDKDAQLSELDENIIYMTALNDCYQSSEDVLIVTQCIQNIEG